MMKSRLRSMMQSDIDTVYAIEISTHKAPWTRDILSDCVLVGYDCRVLEIEQNKSMQVVGYMICRHSFTTCHILNLCISVANQQKGFGTLMLQSVLDSLKSKQAVKTVILEVRPSNKAALALYEKFGFEKDSIKKDYYNDGEIFEDAVLLKKNLI